MQIIVYRNALVIEKLQLLSGVFTKRLMAEHELVFTISTVSPLNLQVGDYVTYKGEVMTINKQPDVKRNHQFEYNIKFQGQRHTLSRFLIKDEGALVFDYSDTLETFMFMFIESINSVDSDWTVGDLEAVEPFTVSFDKVDHLTALNMIAEACKCEWQIKDKTISIKKTVGQARNYPLAYGQHNGLYSIKRVSVENSQIVTRAFAVGGTQNLPASYAFKQLTLQGYDESSEAIDVFGIREGVFEDKEIYPRLIDATVKAVDKINDLSFTITTDLDFDLNGQRIDGQELYVVFRSGMLTDRQFKVLSYNHTTKVIRYEATKDDNGNIYPSGGSIAGIGDKYVLIGLRMPQSYVDAALQELSVKRAEYLASNKVPRVVYEAPIDPLDLKRKNTIIEEGDIIPFRDDKIGLNDNLRVTSVSYPACFPEVLFQGMTFTAEIGQEVTYTRVQKVEKDIKENKDVITQVTKRSYENDRISAMRMRELQELVFDPDGYFDPTNIRPESIETLMLSVGAKSQNFSLNGVRIEPNYQDDANKIAISSGDLIHRELKIEGLGYIWIMNEGLFEGLDPAKPYYLSAKCSKTALTGVWDVSEASRLVDEETGYLYFNLGVLYNVYESKRDYSLTNGMTYINGGQITTGKISAERIDVEQLFSEEITATNFNLNTGRIGNFWVEDGKIIPFKGEFGYDEYDMLELRTNGFTFDSMNRFRDDFFGYVTGVKMSTLTNGAMLDLSHYTDGGINHEQKTHPYTGIRINMQNAFRNALNIFRGSISVWGYPCFNGAVSLGDGRYMHYRQGLLIAVNTDATMPQVNS